MNHRTGAIVEDGVVLVFALVRMTMVAGATLLLAVEVARPEVPAARALHEVPAERGHVPDLRRGGMSGGVGQAGIGTLHVRVRGDLAQR